MRHAAHGQRTVAAVAHVDVADRVEEHHRFVGIDVEHDVTVHVGHDGRRIGTRRVEHRHRLGRQIVCIGDDDAHFAVRFGRAQQVSTGGGAGNRGPGAVRYCTRFPLVGGGGSDFQGGAVDVGDVDVGRQDLAVAQFAADRDTWHAAAVRTGRQVVDRHDVQGQGSRGGVEVGAAVGRAAGVADLEGQRRGRRILAIIGIRHRAVHQLAGGDVRRADFLARGQRNAVQGQAAGGRQGSDLHAGQRMAFGVGIAEVLQAQRVGAVLVQAHRAVEAHRGVVDRGDVDDGRGADTGVVLHVDRFDAHHAVFRRRIGRAVHVLDRTQRQLEHGTVLVAGDGDRMRVVAGDGQADGAELGDQGIGHEQLLAGAVRMVAQGNDQALDVAVLVDDAGVRGGNGHAGAAFDVGGLVVAARGAVAVHVDHRGPWDLDGGGDDRRIQAVGGIPGADRGVAHHDLHGAVARVGVRVAVVVQDRFQCILVVGVGAGAAEVQLRRANQAVLARAVAADRDRAQRTGEAGAGARDQGLVGGAEQVVQCASTEGDAGRDQGVAHAAGQVVGVGDDDVAHHRHGVAARTEDGRQVVACTAAVQVDHRCVVGMGDRDARGIRAGREGAGAATYRGVGLGAGAAAGAIPQVVGEARLRAVQAVRLEADQVAAAQQQGVAAVDRADRQPGAAAVERVFPGAAVGRAVVGQGVDRDAVAGAFRRVAGAVVVEGVDVGHAGLACCVADQGRDCLSAVVQRIFADREHDWRGRGHYRRIVHRGDVDAQGACDRIEVDAAVGGAAVVLHLEAEAGQGRAAAVGDRGVDQLAGGDVGRRHELAGRDGGAVQAQAARLRQARDLHGDQGVGVDVGEAEVGHVQYQRRVFQGGDGAVRAVRRIVHADQVDGGAGADAGVAVDVGAGDRDHARGQVRQVGGVHVLHCAQADLEVGRIDAVRTRCRVVAEGDGGAVVAAHGHAEDGQLGHQGVRDEQLLGGAVLRVGQGHDHAGDVAVLVGDAGVGSGQRHAALAFGVGDAVVTAFEAFAVHVDDRGPWHQHGGGGHHRPALDGAGDQAARTPELQVGARRQAGQWAGGDEVLAVDDLADGEAGVGAVQEDTLADRDQVVRNRGGERAGVRGRTFVVGHRDGDGALAREGVRVAVVVDDGLERVLVVGAGAVAGQDQRGGAGQAVFARAVAVDRDRAQRTGVAAAGGRAQGLVDRAEDVVEGTGRQGHGGRDDGVLDVDVGDAHVVGDDRHFAAARAEGGGEVVAVGGAAAEVDDRRVVGVGDVEEGGAGVHEAAVTVAHRIGQGVVQVAVLVRTAGVQQLAGGQPVLHVAHAVAGDGQDTRVGTGNGEAGRAGVACRLFAAQEALVDAQAQREAGAAVRIDDREAGTDRGCHVFGEHGRWRHVVQGRRVVGAVDGDVQHGRVEQAGVVADGVVEAVLQRLARGQRVDGAVALVDDVGPVAGGAVQGQGAVQAGHGVDVAAQLAGVAQAFGVAAAHRGDRVDRVQVVVGVVVVCQHVAGRVHARDAVADAAGFDGDAAVVDRGRLDGAQLHGGGRARTDVRFEGAVVVGVADAHAHLMAAVGIGQGVGGVVRAVDRHAVAEPLVARLGHQQAVAVGDGRGQGFARGQGARDGNRARGLQVLDGEGAGDRRLGHAAVVVVEGLHAHQLGRFAFGQHQGVGLAAHCAVRGRSHVLPGLAVVARDLPLVAGRARHAVGVGRGVGGQDLAFERIARDGHGARIVGGQRFQAALRRTAVVQVQREAGAGPAAALLFDAGDEDVQVRLGCRRVAAEDQAAVGLHGDGQAEVGQRTAVGGDDVADAVGLGGAAVGAVRVGERGRDAQAEHVAGADGLVGDRRAQDDAVVRVGDLQGERRAAGGEAVTAVGGDDQAHVVRQVGRVAAEGAVVAVEVQPGRERERVAVGVDRGGRVGQRRAVVRNVVEGGGRHGVAAGAGAADEAGVAWRDVGAQAGDGDAAGDGQLELAGRVLARGGVGGAHFDQGVACCQAVAAEGVGGRVEAQGRAVDQRAGGAGGRIEGIRAVDQGVVLGVDEGAGRDRVGPAGAVAVACHGGRAGVGAAEVGGGQVGLVARLVGDDADAAVAIVDDVVVGIGGAGQGRGGVGRGHGVACCGGHAGDGDLSAAVAAGKGDLDFLERRVGAVDGGVDRGGQAGEIAAGEIGDVASRACREVDQVGLDRVDHCGPVAVAGVELIGHGSCHCLGAERAGQRNGYAADGERGRNAIGERAAELDVGLLGDGILAFSGDGDGIAAAVDVHGAVAELAAGAGAVGAQGQNVAVRRADAAVAVAVGAVESIMEGGGDVGAGGGAAQVDGLAVEGDGGAAQVGAEGDVGGLEGGGDRLPFQRCAHGRALVGGVGQVQREVAGHGGAFGVGGGDAQGQAGVVPGGARVAGEGAGAFVKAQPRRSLGRVVAVGGADGVDHVALGVEHVDGVRQAAAFGVGEAVGRDLELPGAGAGEGLVGNRVRQYRQVVGAGDRDVDGLVARGAGRVGDLEFEHVVAGLAGGQRVDRGGLVRGVAPGVGGGVQAQGAVQADLGPGVAGQGAAADAEGERVDRAVDVGAAEGAGDGVVGGESGAVMGGGLEDRRGGGDAVENRRVVHCNHVGGDRARRVRHARGGGVGRGVEGRAVGAVRVGAGEVVVGRVHAQAARGAVPVQRRHEVQARAGAQHQAVGGADAADVEPGDAVGRVLPAALGSAGCVADDDDAAQAAAAVDVGEHAAGQLGHGAARILASGGAGVFQHRGQAHVGVQDWRVVGADHVHGDGLVAVQGAVADADGEGVGAGLAGGQGVDRVRVRGVAEAAIAAHCQGAEVAHAAAAEAHGAGRGRVGGGEGAGGSAEAVGGAAVVIGLQQVVAVGEDRRGRRRRGRCRRVADVGARCHLAVGGADVQRVAAAVARREGGGADHVARLVDPADKGVVAAFAVAAVVVLGDDGAVAVDLQVVVDRVRVTHVDVDAGAGGDAFEDVAVPLVTLAQRVFRVAVGDGAIEAGLEGVAAPGVGAVAAQAARQLDVGAEGRVVVVEGERGGLDAAGLRFQDPVAAQARGAGDVGRGSHVGAGGGGQGLREGGAAVAGGDVAAVQQQVGAVAQGGADGRQFGAVAGQGGFVDRDAAQHQRARRAVRDDVEGADVGAAVEGARDLRQPVFVGVQLHHFDRRIHRCQQGRDVGHGGIDEQDLRSLVHAHGRYLVKKIL